VLDVGESRAESSREEMKWKKFGAIIRRFGPAPRYRKRKVTTKGCKAASPYISPNWICQINSTTVLRNSLKSANFALE
jgi:hypothetical protein